MKPVLLIVAGPNGAGKTTVTTRLRQERWSDDTEYLNPDLPAWVSTAVDSLPRHAEFIDLRVAS